MRVIAGGYSRDSMITYSTEEQHAFNIPGVSDVSLIWNVRKTINSGQHSLAQAQTVTCTKCSQFFQEWDTEFHQKVQRPNSYLTTSGRNDSREVILQAGISAIQ